jgi:hypothetical protein
MRCELGGCGANPTLLAPADNPNWIAVDSTNVHWTAGVTPQPDGGLGPGVVLECATAGCGGTPTAIATGVYPSSVAADSSGLYWGDPSARTVVFCPGGICDGSAVILAGGQDVPNAITTDAQNVYWANAMGGQIMRAAKPYRAVGRISITTSTDADGAAPPAWYLGRDTKGTRSVAL